MIAELKPNRVAMVPANRDPTATVGGDTIFGTPSEFTVDMNEVVSTSLVLEPSAHTKVPIGHELLNEIAKSALRRAERLEKSAGAWTQAGFAFLAARNLSEARRAFQAALSLDPEWPSASLGLARTANEEGRSQEAIGILRNLLRSSPSNAEARVSLALVFVSSGRLKEALELLEADVPDASKWPTLLAARGGVRLMLNDIGGAVSDLRKVVRIRSDWVHARNILGLAELRAGRQIAAERHFRAAVRTGPMNVGALLNLARLLARGKRYEELLNAIERYWRPGPIPVELGLHAAEACLALDDARGARAWLEGIRDRGRTPVEAAIILNNLGVAYSELGFMAEAQREFQRAIESSPNDTAIANYGKLLLESGKTGEAIEWLTGWWRRPGFESLDLGLTLAFALMHAQRSEDAIELARTLTARAEAGERAFGLLSALEADGASDYAAAVETALAGLRQWPDSTLLKNNLSYALLMGGQPERAARYLDAIDDSSLDRVDRVYVTATRGLLALWKTDLVEGRRLYEAALALAGRESLRERVKAKRDLEVARAMLRLGQGIPDAVALLKRAASAKPSAEPYVSHAETELRRLASGDF
jgi:tetratricopeptide (TPR) repeat protein